MPEPLANILAGVEHLYQSNTQTEGGNPSSRVEVSRVINALQSFTDCVRYLNTRRSGGTFLAPDSEAAVQDALYLMIRPWIVDLTPENPTDRIANRYSIKDFVSKSNRLVIEAKYVRSPDHGRSIVKELNDDIETYRYHASCENLIFFIYDPDGFIPDGAALERHLFSPRTYSERILKCYAVIKP